MHYRYVIVGGGLAATAAIEGIRAHDREGSILMVSRENHLPYRRAPLSKDVWRGPYDLDQLSIRPADFYDAQRVEVRLPLVGVIAATRTWCDKVDAELAALGTTATANTMKAAPKVEAK